MESYWEKRLWLKAPRPKTKGQRLDKPIKTTKGGAACLHFSGARWHFAAVQPLKPLIHEGRCGRPTENASVCSNIFWNLRKRVILENKQWLWIFFGQNFGWWFFFFLCVWDCKTCSKVAVCFDHASEESRSSIFFHNHRHLHQDCFRTARPGSPFGSWRFEVHVLGLLQ